MNISFNGFLALSTFHNEGKSDRVAELVITHIFLSFSPQVFLEADNKLKLKFTPDILRPFFTLDISKIPLSSFEMKCGVWMGRKKGNDEKSKMT